MTLDELFRDAANGCSMKGCTHKHGELVLHAACHPDASSWVKVDVDKGTLQVVCAICDTPIVTLQHVMSN
jgi:hypothetical protein